MRSKQHNLNWRRAAQPLPGLMRRFATSVAVGALISLIGVAFHHSIDIATRLRLAHPVLLLLLPIVGAAIVLLYHVCGMEQDRGTNLVLVAVRSARHLRLRTAPLIFLSTVATHLAGGSAGREGAALQLGGSVADTLGKGLRLNNKEQ